MAEADRPKLPSKEMIRFASNVLDYIWQNYSFNSQSLNKAFNEKLKLDEEIENETVCHFNEDIGKAVLCTQYLLRDFCYFYFEWFGDDLVTSNSAFTLCVYSTLCEWSLHRSDVFLGFFDSAAIVAEAFLYCDAVKNVEVDLDKAPFMLSSFLSRKKMKSQFFINGGWKQLKEKAYNDFVYLKINLERFVSFRRFKYQRLDYNCSLIKMLLNSPVPFPVEDCKICPDCEVPSFYRRMEFICTVSWVWKAMKSYEEECVEDEQEEALDLSIPSSHVEEFEGKEETMTKSFICRVLGNLEDQDVPEEKVETVSKKKKKKRKKKRKSKSKTESDLAQTVKAMTSSTKDADLEADNSQHTEESDEE